MCLSTRFYVLIIVLLARQATTSESRRTKEGLGKYFLNLVGFVHGFKVGQHFGLQYSPVVIPAQVIVLPSNNQQQSVTIQTTANEESYQEAGYTTQTIKNGITKQATYVPDNTDTVTMKDEVEQLRQSAKRAAVAENMKNEDLNEETTIISIEENTGTEKSTLLTNTTKKSLVNTTTEKPIVNENFYPTAVYNITMLDDLAITTVIPDSNTTVALMTTTSKVDVTSTTEATDSNKMKIEEVSSWKGPYPAANYDNRWIYQLSLTTEYPKRNEELSLPTKDERWKQFNPNSGGFKPLGGLYYDGFLHVPILKKTVWFPYNNNYV